MTLVELQDARAQTAARIQAEKAKAEAARTALNAKLLRLEVTLKKYDGLLAQASDRASANLEFQEFQALLSAE